MAIKKGHRRLTLILEDKIIRALHTKKGMDSEDINSYITNVLLNDETFKKYLKLVEENK